VAVRLQNHQAMSFRKILCPIDFSEGSREALRLAVDKLGPDAHLVLVHVWQPPFVYGPDAGFPGNVFIETKTLAENELATWKGQAEQLGARRVSTVLATGAPWHEIVELARQDPAIDLIAMGTHGRTGIKHVLLGSVAEKVVRHAPCPVLAVRVRD
jgi:nucleotide-binding universal stress UspA family protein